MHAGIIAAKMGLPVELFVATNENDFMVKLLQQQQLKIAPEARLLNSCSEPYNNAHIAGVADK
jgi:hypothetical protein